LFSQNQWRFVGGSEELSRITFAIEETQSVIRNKSSISKFVGLAKDGRKYQLGCIFITQQLGSVSKEILSQGDNFFIFHLLSKYDKELISNHLNSNNYIHMKFEPSVKELCDFIISILEDIKNNNKTFTF